MDGKQQELEAVLWGTPAPIMTMINGEMVRIIVKGECRLAVTDPALLEQKSPDPAALVSQARSILATAAADVVAGKSRSVAGVSELAGMADELGTLIAQEAAAAFAGIGVEPSSVAIHAVEAV